ncbi:MAG: type II toxin-antitoxin system VapC family toxin [Actinomycetota bacterium]
MVGHGGGDHRGGSPVAVFIDTGVLMYAAGAAHPLRAPCIRVLELVGADRLEAVTSAEVVQEIFHRFTGTPRAAAGIELAEAALDLFSPVLGVTNDIVRRMPDLARRYPSHTARDLLHVATCLEHGMATIVSPDTDFDSIEELRRISPADEPTLNRHVRP